MSRHISETRSLLFTNDSDSPDPADDFVSFPTLPDPEQAANRSISTIITKTLRKVTNNASNLVHNYASPRHGAPDVSDHIDELSMYSSVRYSPDKESADESRKRLDAINVGPSVSMPLSTATTETFNAAGSSLNAMVPLSASYLQESDSLVAPRALPDSTIEEPPRVTSDNRFLRISTMQPSTQSASLVSKSEVTVLNTDTASSVEPVTIIPEPEKIEKPIKVPSASQKTLQNRISSIFNNLPNDIELSDDSASDQETINNDSILSSSQVLKNTLSNVTTDTKPPSLRAERGRLPRPVRLPESPSLSTFYALRSKAPSVTRKISANFPNSILDGAKSIISNNMVSSTSSITEKKKKKKKKAPKLSENPLKNGGIPQKFWMNDAFVSDCLNCFKPFSAFRRKHHCRFCGQIFCSNCTLFISFSQYKEQRKAKDGKVKDSKPPTDKLRVCKQCYNDVIVYLSDDSMSSSGEEEEEGEVGHEDAVFDFEDNSTIDENLLVPEHPLSRFRSHSVNSRKESFNTDSPAVAANRAFLNKDTESPTHLKPPRLEAMQRSPEVLPHKHAPQMAIPTTRTGEAVEIPVPKNSYAASLAPLSTNLALIAMKNAANSTLLSTSVPQADIKETPLKSPWFVPYHNSLSTSELPRPSSLENFGLLYNSFLGKAMAPLIMSRVNSKSDKDYRRARKLLLNPSQPETEPEEDFESENEDEEVMSLYTSLNHGKLHNSANQSNLSPRPNTLKATNMSVVPTLHEFPTMTANDKYIPAPLSLTSSNLWNRMDLNQLDAMHIGSINENRLRADYRSVERANASLIRMRLKRKNKLVRNKLLLTQNNLRLPQVDTSFPNVSHSNSQNGSNNTSSPVSTPTSPMPRPQLGYFDKKDTPRRSMSNPGIAPHADVLLIYSPSQEEDRDNAQVLHYSLDDQSNLINRRSFYTDPDMSNYGYTSSLDGAYDGHIDKMLVQCLEDCDIKDPKEQVRWKSSLLETLSNINLLKITDTLDIKQYVKIKKILGGSIEDTSVVNGLFITKNIDSKRMSSSIDNPKIALLMFPIEYLKQKEQFISLRIVKSQQAVYISNLVSRLISLEPDIIVVGDTVSGFAARLLEEANVTVLSNVKPQVIERISRYTKGDIFQSVNDLFFKKGSLGSCGRFEVKKFVYKDLIKTYSYFTGTDPEFGFTICLRGGDEEALGSAKYATESLIPAVLNTKFERSFLKDSSLIIEEAETRPELEAYLSLNKCMQYYEGKKSDQKLACVQSIEHNGICNYIKLFSERILSVSPAVKFTLPKALLNLAQAFEELVAFDEFNDMIQSITPEIDIDQLWLTKLQFDFNLERFNGKDDVMRVLKFVSENTLNSLVSEFTFRSRIWTNSLTYNSYQLYPIFHKSIHILHSTVSIKHATPCTGPAIVVIDYYTDNDKCFGMFLDQALHESEKTCDECGDLLLNHYKSYVHANAKIDLIIEKIDDVHIEHDFKGKNERIMWSYCPECNISTPIVALSDEAYYLSLGKYFELSFWADGVSFFKDCPHDYFKQHVKYFGFNDMVLRMEYSQIDTYEVVVPRKKLDLTLDIDIKLKVEAYEQIQKKSGPFFQSISKRLNRVKVDTFDKAEAGHEKVEELKKRLKTQEELIAAKLLKIYSSTLPTNYLSLNVVLRDLQELGVAWDNEFNDFETNFLPTENEITKITQFHLRNFLMDRLDKDLDREASSSQEKLDNIEDVKESPLSNDRAIDLLDEEHSADLDKKDYFALGLRSRVPLSIIEDKILQIKQSFENDSQRFTSKSPTKSRTESIACEPIIEQQSQGPNKVQDLTNYFNQMTLEFQRQREEVLEKKSSKFRAIPIVNSLPIVEIYDNIEDVVDVDDDQRERDRRAVRLMRSESSRTLPTEPITEGSTRQLSESNMEQLWMDKRIFGKDLAGKQKLEIPQPEKNSLLKSLTNFWADRSATLWDPLEYPLDFTEHTFADSDVIVREDEPSSLVAFCLSSNDYKQKIIAMASNRGGESTDNLESNDLYKKKVDTFIKIEKKFKKKIDDPNNGMSELEAIMTKTKSNHLKYQFLDGNTDLSCKIFYSEQFEAFRKACSINDSFIQSLSRCVKWNSKGGKSGSNFLKTLDNRFIVKELSKSELESFVSIAPFYFKYISQSTFNTLTTAIAKIFGFYQVEIKNSINGKTFRMDFLIMENLFYNRQTTRIFDLKGSMRNRHVKQTGKENEVLLDENMIEYIYESPVFVKEQLKKLLRGSLFNDTSFLSAMDVMDYSLVIGIDDTSHKLYVGIIDWLRTFTWDKKVENWVKGNSLVGKKGKDPTIVTPKQYRIRFREAMDRYILEVPDIWYEGK